MEFCISDDAAFDESDIIKAVDLRISLQLVTHSLPKKTQEYMSLLLSKYLNECGMGEYFNKLNYCLSEILSNAIKANMKRVYFEEKNLDINSPADYEKGMESFRNDVLENKEYYFEKLRKGNLFVIYSLTADQDKLIIEVRNNALITPIEMERVKEKMAEINSCNLVDANIDETEGAGFGIKSIILTLQGFGLPGDHYQLYTEDGNTVAKLIVENPPLMEI